MAIQPTYTGLTIAKTSELVVSLDDAKRQLRLEDSTHYDPHIRVMIGSVCDHIERLYSVAILTQTVTETHSAFPMLSTEPLYMHIKPGVSVTSVSYIDSDGATQTFSSSNYETKTNSRGLFIIPKVTSEWPTDLAVRPDAVTVVYQAGFGATAANVPSSMKMAILNVIGKLDASREDPVSEKITASDILLSPFFHYAA